MAHADSGHEAVSAPHADGVLPEEPLSLQEEAALASIPNCSSGSEALCVRYCESNAALGTVTPYACRLENTDALSGAVVTADAAEVISKAFNAPVCRDTGRRFELVYAQPADMTTEVDATVALDLRKTRNRQIRDIMGRSNARLVRDGLDSGGLRSQYPVFCNGGTTPYVPFATLPTVPYKEPERCMDAPEGRSPYWCVVKDLREHPSGEFVKPGTKYIVFVEVSRAPSWGTCDDGSPCYAQRQVCGEGLGDTDRAGSALNANNSPDQVDYAVVYVNGALDSGETTPTPDDPPPPSCMTSTSTMHEAGHTMGAVQPYDDVPQWDGDDDYPVGHTDVNFDVMFRDQPDLQGATRIDTKEDCEAVDSVRRTRPLIRFDCRYNTYFDTGGTLSGEYLVGGGWNLGNPQWNQYLYFGSEP